MRKILLTCILHTLYILLPITLYGQANSRKELKNGDKEYKLFQYQKALNAYDKALKEDSTSPRAHYNIANTNYRLNQWKKALEGYQQFLNSARPDQYTQTQVSQAFHNIGNTLLQQQEIEKAIDAYKQALRMNPDDDETRYNLAVAQKLLSDQQNNEEENNDSDGSQQQQPGNAPQERQSNNQSQISKDNIEQILKALEADEKQIHDKATQKQNQRQSNKNKNNHKYW